MLSRRLHAPHRRRPVGIGDRIAPAVVQWPGPGRARPDSVEALQAPRKRANPWL
jgi:hypothetical protein